jgi:methyltransferase (TIGR00027 family)
MDAASTLPSRTALTVALCRALGARDPNPHTRNPDSLAEGFFGPAERRLLDGIPLLAAFDAPWEAGIGSGDQALVYSALIHNLRTRHCDAVLVDAVREGAGQVVILGAGLDTRAYRFRELLAAARVFEVDFPTTQQYKRERVREAIGEPPANLTYVSIDFASQTLEDVLPRAGFEPGRRTFFLWEGVSVYLPEQTVRGMLRYVATNAGPGGGILFDYFDSRLARGEHDDSILRQYVNAFAAWGEVIAFGIPDLEIQGFVSGCGLAFRSDYTIGELCVKYLPQFPPASALALRWGYRFCHAVSGPSRRECASNAADVTST